MSAKRDKLRRELQADFTFEEELRTLNAEVPTPSEDLISAAQSPDARLEEGRVLIPRPDAGGASNDAPPAVDFP